jgi:transposase
VIPAGVEVFVALAPIDLRYGFDRLAGLVEEHVGRSARSGALFVFYGKRKTALKVLFFDGSGMCLFYKRADSGTFVLPEPPTPDTTSLELSERELEALLDGVEVRVQRKKRAGRRIRVH